MNSDRFSSLVSAEWLAQHLDDPGMRVLDASWHLPGTDRDAAVEFEQGHIPGAAFFDIDRVVDPASGLPHTLPPEDAFAEAVGALGIGNDSRVVVYDSHGLYSAPRAWWMFRVFGHEAVAILDGGLPAWTGAGNTLEAGPATVQPRTFSARFDPTGVRSLADMQRNLDVDEAVVLDARPEARFTGRAAEPRPGVRPGHIPGSINIPFDRLVDPATGRMHGNEALAELFAKTEGRSVVCSCGSGVTACALAFALHRLDRDDVAVYDGSWAEWGSRRDTPVDGGE